MFEIKAIVRPVMLDKVLDELRAIPDLPGVAVSPVRALGRAISASGSPGHESVEVPMVVLSVVVDEELVERATRTIRDTARTGHHGDGKIFVVPVHDAVRIRTGERGRDAL